MVIIMIIIMMMETHKPLIYCVPTYIHVVSTFPLIQIIHYFKAAVMHEFICNSTQKSLGNFRGNFFDYVEISTEPYVIFFSLKDKQSIWKSFIKKFQGIPFLNICVHEMFTCGRMSFFGKYC